MKNKIKKESFNKKRIENKKNSNRNYKDRI